MYSLISTASSSSMHACYCSRCCCHCASTVLLNGATGLSLHQFGYGSSWSLSVLQLALVSGPTTPSTGLSLRGKQSIQTVLGFATCNLYIETQFNLDLLCCNLTFAMKDQRLLQNTKLYFRIVSESDSFHFVSGLRGRLAWSSRPCW